MTDLVGYPEDRFSHDAAHLSNDCNLETVRCSFFGM